MGSANHRTTLTPGGPIKAFGYVRLDATAFSVPSQALLDANNTVNTFALSTQVLNADGAFDAEAPTKLVVPDGYGYNHARVVTHAKWNIATDTSYRDVRPHMNGAAIAQATAIIPHTAGCVRGLHMGASSPIFPVVPGDYIEMLCRQESGGAISILAGSYMYAEFYAL